MNSPDLAANMTSRLAVDWRNKGRNVVLSVMTNRLRFFHFSLSFSSLTWTQTHGSNWLSEFYLTWSMKCTILILTLSWDCGRIPRQGQGRFAFGLFILCNLLILLLISTFLLGMLILFRLRVEHLKMRSSLTGRCVSREQRNAAGAKAVGRDIWG